MTAIDIHASERLKRLLGYLHQDPDNSALMFDTIDQCIQENQIGTARTLVEQARAAGMPAAGVQHREALIAMLAGAYVDAIPILDALLTQNPEDAALRYNLAYASYQAGRYQRARELLETIAGQFTTNPSIATLYTLSLYQLGDVEPATAYAESVLAAQPQHPDLPGILTLLYFDTNRLAQCRQYVDIVLAQTPDHPMAQIAASGLAVLDAQLDRAEKFARQVIECNEHDGRAWSALGIALLAKHDISGAGRALQQAVKFMPSHVGTWHLLAWTQVFQHNARAAEISFKRALELDRTFGESHGGLAIVAQMRGEGARSKELIEKARRLSPGSLSMQYAKMLQIEQHEGKQAAQLFLRDVLSQAPSAEGATLLAMVQRQLLRNHSS